MRVLDLGSGPNPYKGEDGETVVHLDKLAYGNNLIHDITVLPLPFDSESFDVVIASHIFEHIEFSKLLELMQDIHRILTKEGVLKVRVPFYNTLNAINLDHKLFFHYTSFDNFRVGKCFHMEYGLSYNIRKMEYTPTTLGRFIINLPLTKKVSTRQFLSHIFGYIVEELYFELTPENKGGG